MAIGCAAPIPKLPSVAHALALAAAGAGLLLAGPLTSEEFARSSFTNASTFVYFVRDGNNVSEERLPAFYGELAAATDAQPVIEYPWSNLSTHALDAYQKHHGQPVYGVAIAQSLSDERLALRRLLQPSTAAYLASPARWLVLHRDLQHEGRQIHTSDPNYWMRLEARPEIWKPVKRAGRGAERVLKRRFGEPDREGDGLVVWDLERLRAEEG